MGDIWSFMASVHRHILHSLFFCCGPCVDILLLKGLVSFGGIYLVQECKFLLPLGLINPLVGFAASLAP